MLTRYLMGGTLALSAITAAGWYVTKGHLDRVRLDLATSRAAYEQTAKTLEAERAIAADLESKYSIELEKLTNANNEIDRLRSDVESGRAKLRIKATCPAVPKDAPAERSDDATAPTLEPDAESAHWDLRRYNEQVTTQILMLQAYARKCHSG